MGCLFHYLIPEQQFSTFQARKCDTLLVGEKKIKEKSSILSNLKKNTRRLNHYSKYLYNNMFECEIPTWDPSSVPPTIRKPKPLSCRTRVTRVSIHSMSGIEGPKSLPTSPPYCVYLETNDSKKFNSMLIIPERRVLLKRIRLYFLSLSGCFPIIFFATPRNS